MNEIPFKYFIGIDPGKTGCVAILDSGSGLDLHPIPVDGKEYNIFGMKNILTIYKEFKTVVVIERAQCMPKQGSVSAFTFGKGYGIWLGILGCLELPHIIVHSRVWTKCLLAGAPGEGKERNFNVATRLFPQWQPELRKEWQYADAILLAEYARRLYSQQTLHI